MIVAVIAAAIRAGTPILFATLGEILAERAGVINLGMEGMMLVGALAGFATNYTLFMKAAASGTPGEGTLQLCLWTGIAAGMGAAGLMALAHAFLTITLRANQVVSGLALTLFGAGITGFLGKTFVGLPSRGFAPLPVPGLSSVPIVGPAFFSHNILVYVSYLLVPLIWFLLFRTRAGLTMRSVGESPRAADVMGINVIFVRYFYVVVGGLLCGLAGAYLSLAYTPGWAEGMTGGRGWIAVALVIFSGWNPIKAAFGAYLFGGISAIQMRMQAAGTTIPTHLLLMLPYIFTILVLLISQRRTSGEPASLGNPYIREERE
jgi:simple sugar transport system permease protein